MMGRHARQNELWTEPVNLARRIPADHPLRKLREALRLDFVREEVASCYGRKGNVSVDPVLVMKMMLLLFWDNVRSERELMRIIPLRIDYLWFLGYNLEDEIPNHSVLSKARRRWGPCGPMLRSTRSWPRRWLNWRRRQRKNRAKEVGRMAAATAARSISATAWQPTRTQRSSGKQRVGRVNPVTRVIERWMTRSESSLRLAPPMGCGMMGRN